MRIHVEIDCPDPSAPEPEIKVKGDGLESQLQLATLLLTVVERITEVSTDGYVALVNQRRMASRPNPAGGAS